MLRRNQDKRAAEQQLYADRLKLAVVAMLAGLGVGTMLALLFAPRSGEETRKSLADGAEQLVDSGRAIGSKVVENIVDGVEKFQQTVKAHVGS